MADAQDPERASLEYWLWESPPHLGMPIILEVRIWEAEDRRVETPTSFYAHWELSGSGWPNSAIAEHYIMSPESFARMRASGDMTLIGTRPTQLGDIDLHLEK